MGCGQGRRWVGLNSLNYLDRHPQSDLTPEWKVRLVMWCPPPGCALGLVLVLAIVTAEGVVGKADLIGVMCLRIQLFSSLWSLGYVWRVPSVHA